LKAYLYELHYMMNVQVIFTKNLKGTINEIYHLWSMFQEEPDDHDSLRKFYTAPMPSVTMMPGILRRMAKELNYIEWERSLTVEKRFKTVQEMVNATEEDWMDIFGFGRVIAHSAVQELQT
jgi:ERCC4-type nuclease